MYFGVLVDSGDDRTFKLFKTQEEAHNYANNIVRMGYVVTLFDYDKEDDIYLELCSM